MDLKGGYFGWHECSVVFIIDGLTV